jgi:outer membrane beta-barrel protein
MPPATHFERLDPASSSKVSGSDRWPSGACVIVISRAACGLRDRVAESLRQRLVEACQIGEAGGPGVVAFFQRLLSDSERQLTYYNLSLGYNILPGEVFIGEGRAYNTGLYVIGGLGSTRFAGDDRFTVNFGAGYRFLLTDSIALHIDFRDHLFDIDLFGEENTTHNLEGTLGVTVFF